MRKSYGPAGSNSPPQGSTIQQTWSVCVCVHLCVLSVGWGKHTLRDSLRGCWLVWRLAQWPWAKASEGLYDVCVCVWLITGLQQSLPQRHRQEKLVFQLQYKDNPVHYNMIPPLMVYRIIYYRDYFFIRDTFQAETFVAPPLSPLITCQLCNLGKRALMNTFRVRHRFFVSTPLSYYRRLFVDCRRPTRWHSQSLSVDGEGVYFKGCSCSFKCCVI